MKPWNTERADRAERTLKYYKLHLLSECGEFDEEDIEDLLTDLMHLCGDGMYARFQSATMHYTAELIHDC